MAEALAARGGSAPRISPSWWPRRALAFLLALATLAAPTVEPSAAYDALLAQGLAQGREQKFDEARASFDQAIALDPCRPEAWVERGGLSFLQTRYPAAESDLRSALRLAPDDAYARDLLATTLQLLGRSDAALREWNRLGQPTLGKLTLSGLRYTRDSLVRRELGLTEGQALNLAALRAARLRLAELGVFERATLRPVPLGGGRADVEAAFVERHGFFSSPAEFVASSAVLAVQGRARLRYANLAGLGLSFGGEYRFQRNRPEVALFGELPRPLGLGIMLRVRGYRGRQAYELDGSFSRRVRGFDLEARRVLGARTIVELAYEGRDRSLPADRAALQPGWIAGPRLAADLRLVDATRFQLAARLAGFASWRALGGAVAEQRVEALLVGKLFLTPPEGTAVERSLLAWQGKLGWLSRKTPGDEWLALGTGPDMEWPLRARRVYQDGVLGATEPLRPRVLLSNLEYRRRFYRGPAVQAGFVAFYDSASTTGDPGPATYHDVGVGLRVGLRAGPILRLDYGHGLADGRDSVSLGLGYFF